MKHKTLSFLLAIFMSMVASEISAHDFEVGGIYYQIISSTSPLTVAVTYRGSSIQEYTNEYVGSVTIPESVTYNGKIYSVESIGNYAFSDCSGLTSITIPNSVTSIGDAAFNECTGLTSITIPNSVTSIGEYAFHGTAWYNNQPNGMVYAGKWAYEYKGTMPEGTEIVLDEGTVGIAGSAFSGCSGLTSVTIPESVTSISGGAFSGCTGLTSVTIPNGVTNIGQSAFDGCTSLTSVTIPESVTSISRYAFSGCTGLTSVTIPNGVTNIGQFAFDGCSSLTSVEIPNSVTSIGWYAFGSCGLTSIYIPKNVINIERYAFSRCEGLEKIVVAEGNPVYDSRENCNALIETASNTLISGCKNTIIPNSVNEIYYYAFDRCTGLNSITIPESVTKIWEGAFYDCSSLTSVAIPGSVTSIGRQAFFRCKALKSVSIGNGVKSIGASAFYKCSNLISVTIPNSVNSIGGDAFMLCSGIESIVVENENPVYDSREGCNAIIETASSTLHTGCKNTVIPNSVVTISIGAFSNCTDLTSIAIPESVTSIGRSAFKDCSSLTSVKVEWDTPVSLDDSYTFSNSANATLYVPKGTKEAYMNADYWKDFKEIVEYGADIENIALLPLTITLVRGGAKQLTATISPAEATPHTALMWSSSNTNVATVDLNGLVVAAAVGTCTITCGASDGNGASATCEVTVTEPVCEYVDLGLPSGTLWATCNVGASSPEEYGSYFAWGETTAKSTYNWSTYKYCNGSSETITKYCTNSSYGNVDDKTELDLSDDAAYVFWGSDWCMPSIKQINELTSYDYTTNEKFTLNGISGRKITSKINGNSIFLPANGLYIDSSISNMYYNDSFCWARELLSSEPDFSAYMDDGKGIVFFYRYVGACVRPVRASTVTREPLVDGTPFVNDVEQDVDELTYTRTFSNTDWQALYVPFEMTYSDWQADFEMARLNDVHQWDDDDDGTIDRTELEAVKMKSGKTEANTPYLIRAKSTGEKTITLTNATLYKAEENSFDVSSWNTKFTFTGTYSGVSGTDMFTNGYYAMGGGTLHQAESSAYDLSPMRWYMTVTDRNGNPKSLGEVKVMVFGDDTDGISPTENAEKTGDTEVYDLSGRRTDKPTKKGVYIKNGRKVIVR